MFGTRQDTQKTSARALLTAAVSIAVFPERTRAERQQQPSSSSRDGIYGSEHFGRGPSSAAAAAAVTGRGRRDDPRGQRGERRRVAATVKRTSRACLGETRRLTTAAFAAPHGRVKGQGRVRLGLNAPRPSKGVPGATSAWPPQSPQPPPPLLAGTRLCSARLRS